MENEKKTGNHVKAKQKSHNPKIKLSSQHTQRN